MIDVAWVPDALGAKIGTPVSIWYRDLTIQVQRPNYTLVQKKRDFTCSFLALTYWFNLNLKKAELFKYTHQI